MKSALFTALMLTVFSGCTKSVDQSEVQAVDHELQANADCFVSLIAGPKMADGKLETVSFAHGLCQGSSRALDKISKQKSVILVKNGETKEAQIYIEGNNVIAKTKDDKTVIGALSKNPDDAELALNLSVKLELLINSSSGSATVWKMGSDVKGQESIRLTLK